MKLKKLFAGIVAVAMMATMAAPVFAATAVVKEKTVPVTDNIVAITVNYTGSDFGSDKIKLELDATDKGAPYAVKNSSATLTSVADKKIQVSSDWLDVTETKPATTATLNVTLPAYDNVGTYFYKLKQVSGTTAGMKYDTDQLYLMVNVINADAENLIGGYTCKAALFKTDPENLSGDSLKNAKIDSLTNVYTSATYNAKKVVKGSLGDRNQEFSFCVTFTKSADQIVNGKIMMTLPGQRAVELTPTWENDKTYTTPVFTMKHGQTATFANVPKDVTVVVDEMNGNDAVADDTDFTVNGNTYHVTYEHKSVTMTGEDATATVTNRSTTNVDTGVILDNAPYIALLTIVAAGAVVMIMKKRRNYED